MEKQTIEKLAKLQDQINKVENTLGSLKRQGSRFHAQINGEWLNLELVPELQEDVKEFIKVAFDNRLTDLVNTRDNLLVCIKTELKPTYEEANINQAMLDLELSDGK
jgi:SMC interacting uncharacterized protein involved in chromosome segregation